MPPPPPPSRSYLWKFDDLSSSASASGDEEAEDPWSLVQTCKTSILDDSACGSLDPMKRMDGSDPKTKSIESNNNTNDEMHPEERMVSSSSSESASEDEEILPKKQHKQHHPKHKKKKGHKKKKKKKQNNHPTSSSSPPRRSVSFGDISVHSFPRGLGLDVVPGDGGWPLGMVYVTTSSSVPNDQQHPSLVTVETLSVEEYEMSKQERLLQRWKTMMEKQQQQNENLNDNNESLKDFGTSTDGSSSNNRSICSSTEWTEKEPLPSLVLETRQWDHKRGVRNPLFRMLTEQERMAILLGDDTTTTISEKQPQQQPPQSSSSPSSPNSTKTTSPSSPCSNNTNKSQKSQKQNAFARNRRRTRSFSENNSNKSSNHHHSSNITTRRTRSFTESYDDDEFSQANIHSIRNELERIRNSRTMEGSNGCTCRKLQVYLLPPNAGKKAHHRRLKLTKVKEELKKRHALPEHHDQLSREQLELTLHDLVEQEPCCTSHSDCPCVAHGIECQADTCSCWYESHQTKDHQKQQQQQQLSPSQPNGDSIWLTPKEITARCGNRYGTYVVDLHKIDRFRRSYLSSGMATTRDATNRNNENNSKDAMLYCTECARD